MGRLEGPCLIGLAALASELTHSLRSGVAHLASLFGLAALAFELTHSLRSGIAHLAGATHSPIATHSATGAITLTRNRS